MSDWGELMCAAVHAERADVDEAEAAPTPAPIKPAASRFADEDADGDDVKVCGRPNSRR